MVSPVRLDVNCKIMHKVKACVVGCIDFRFRDHEDEFLKHQEWGDSYDLITIAGGSRDFISPVEEIDGKYVWKQLKLSVDLHDPEVIVFVDHQDCGGYAQDGTIPNGLEFAKDEEEHAKFFKQLKEKLQESYPSKQYKFFFAGLDGVVEEVEV